MTVLEPSGPSPTGPSSPDGPSDPSSPTGSSPTGPSGRKPGVWRLSWQVASWRRELFRETAFYWFVFMTIPALTWWCGGKAFDAVQAGDATRSALWALAVLAAEITQMGFLWLGALSFTRVWVLLNSILQANMLNAQVANGRPDAGRAVASAGEAITRFRDDADDVARFIDGWVDVLGGTLFAIIAMVLMAMMDTTATVLVVLPMVSIIVLTWVLERRVKRLREADRAATTAVTGFVGDAMAAATTIKVADKAQQVTDRLAVLAERRRRTAVADRVTEQTIMSWSAGATDVAIALVIITVAPKMVAGTFTLGNLALFLGLLSWLGWVPRMAGRLLARRKQTEVAFDGMRQLVADQDPLQLVTHRPLAIGVDDLAVSRPIVDRVPLQRLDVVELSVRYPDGNGLAPISFSLDRGSFTVITGVVGSGKSVLLRALVGLLDQSEAVISGQVRWNGVVVEDRAGFFRPPQSAYLPQVPQLLSDSVADNILLGLDPDSTPLQQSLALAAVDADISEMPNGVDTLIGPRGMRLSGGQRQRVAAARSLVHQPELVVLDDISSALDVETELTLWTNLAEAGATVLAVSHRNVAFDRADQVITI